MRLNPVRILVPVLLAALVAVGIYLALPRFEESGQLEEWTARPEDPEILRLREKWGAKKYSRENEELFILDFFDGRRDGFFVDVGAFDYKDKSNTYRLESELGWSGIAIDALEHFRQGYEEHRPKTKFFAFYVSDTSTVPAEFYIVEGRRSQSTGVRESAERRRLEQQRKITTVEVPQITLDDLLDREGVTSVDFLNMDIELAEPAALRGFDIDRFRPDLVCIEAHPPVNDFIEQYFADHGYRKIELWSDLDPLNSYFTLPELARRFES